MAMTKLTGSLPRIILAATALVTATMVSTCDFLTSDTFPRWLSYVESSVDFRSIAVAQGLGADAYIENLEFAPYVAGGTDYSKVLVYASGNNTSRLILLDSDELSFSLAKTYGGFARALASVSNGFMCGTQIVDPLSPGNIPSAAPGWTNSSSVKVFRDGEAVTGLNIAVDQNTTTTALFRQYTAAWVLGANGTRTFDSVAGLYNIIDADRVYGYSVLGQRQDNGQTYAATFPDAASFTAGGTVFDSATAIKTGPFPIADSYAWLTADGPVAYYRDKNNRIIRYRWGTGDFTTGARAEELDSLLFDDNDIQLLSFDPTGTWWFVYDKLSGRLYKLRTWW